MRLYSESKQVKTERRPVSDLLLLILFLLSPSPEPLMRLNNQERLNINYRLQSGKTKDSWEFTEQAGFLACLVGRNWQAGRLNSRFIRFSLQLKKTGSILRHSLIACFHSSPFRSSCFTPAPIDSFTYSLSEGKPKLNKMHYPLFHLFLQRL